MWLLKSSTGPKSPLQYRGFTFCNAGFAAHVSSLTGTLLFLFPFLSPSMPGNRYRGKKGIYEALKETEASSNSCHRQSPQTMWSPHVTLQARLSFLFPLCVCKLGFDSSQAVIYQSKPKAAKMCHTKLPAKHSPEGTGGQFLMRRRRRGKRETATTSENIHPLKHLTHISEKS